MIYSINSPVRVVYDVNVLFSWAGWRGAPYHCVESARDPSRVESVSCEAILNKFAEKLRSKLNFDSNQTQVAPSAEIPRLRLGMTRSFPQIKRCHSERSEESCPLKTDR